MLRSPASSSVLLGRRLRRACRAMGLPGAVALQLAGGACSHHSASAPPEAAPSTTADRPGDLPICGCKTPCAAHVEKSPCACKQAEPSPTAP